MRASYDDLLNRPNHVARSFCKKTPEWSGIDPDVVSMTSERQFTSERREQTNQSSITTSQVVGLQLTWKGNPPVFRISHTHDNTHP